MAVFQTASVVFSDTGAVNSTKQKNKTEIGKTYSAKGIKTCFDNDI